MANSIEAIERCRRRGDPRSLLLRPASCVDTPRPGAVALLRRGEVVFAEVAEGGSSTAIVPAMNSGSADHRVGDVAGEHPDRDVGGQIPVHEMDPSRRRAIHAADRWATVPSSPLMCGSLLPRARPARPGW